MHPTPHTIYLLRHGEVAGPAALYGRTDVPLSAHGWQQLRQQCARLVGLTRLVSSPLQRCQAFAEQLSAARQLDLCTLTDLRECDFGRWDGVAFDDMPPSVWPELEAFWQAPATRPLSGGEPLEAMQRRVTAAWAALLQQLHASATAQTVLVVTHGGVIRLLLAEVLQLDWRNAALFSQWRIDYASVSKLTLPRIVGAAASLHYVALPHA